MAFVEHLVKEHKVAVIPGSACGMPGWVRVAYANLPSELCQEACRRLRGGFEAWARK